MDESTVTDRPRVLVMGRDTTEIIARYVLASGATWVSVEGFSQAGKSSFAARLANAPGWKHVHLDGMAHECKSQLIQLIHLPDIQRPREEAAPLRDIEQVFGLEPHEVRLKNLIAPEMMPFDNITKKHFDSGDYPEAVRRAADVIEYRLFVLIHRMYLLARRSKLERSKGSALA